MQAAGAPAGNNETGSPPVFTDRGYAHVLVARRGMGLSWGEDAVFLNDTDVADHAKIIQWASGQPWCDGQVVLFGTSYYGLTQLQVARLRPPALKGFFAIETCTDYFRHIAMFGGAPQPDFFALWMGANFTPFQFKLHVPPLARALASHITNSPLKRFWEPLLKKRMSRIMKGFERLEPARQTREVFAALMLDGKTRATCPLPNGPSGGLDAIRMPPAASDDAFALIETINAPGAGPPRHRHREAEIFRVIEGRHLYEMDGRRFYAEAGDVVSIPGGSEHVFVNLTDQPARQFILVYLAQSSRVGRAGTMR